MTRLKRTKQLPSENKNDVRFGTPQEVAEYRAQRLWQSKPDTIIEVGAGAGFQTAEFAKVAKQVIAIEIDVERLGRAKLPGNVHAIAGDALDSDVIAQVKKLATGKTVVFLDPQRAPSAAQRELADIKPDIKEFLKAYGAITKDVAIELPPFLSDIPFACEREYLSIDGKLNRLTIYAGSLRMCDISVIGLPSGERIEHSGPLVAAEHAIANPSFVLEPDAALIQAGLVPMALKIPAASISKKALVAEVNPRSAFFTAYKILEQGQRQVEGSLPRLDCATVILHGQIDPGLQKAMLRKLNERCRGKRRLHLFFPQWILANKIAK